MKKLLYYSDCSFFAGCENMLINFFSDNKLKAKYDISFAYRNTYEYVKGFRSRFENNGDIIEYPLNIWTFNEFKKKVRNKKIRRMLNYLPIKEIILIRNVVLFIKFLIKNDYDLIHINNGGYPGAYSCVSIVIAAKMLKIKKIVYVVNNIAVGYEIKKRKRDVLFDNFVSKNIDFFITGSKVAGEQLSKVLKLEKTKIINIHNGIKLREISETKQEVYKRLNINPELIKIGVVAILEERKGHMYLLESLKKLQNCSVEMPQLYIEGEGKLYKQLKEYVLKNGIAEYVHFIGVEKNIFNFLNAMDILVLPSIYNEDFPNIIIEAMALGKPVIATNIAGIPEQIEHMNNGLLIEPRNSEKLSDAIKYYLLNPELRKKHGEKSKYIFYEKFTDEISVRRYINLYSLLFKK